MDKNLKRDDQDTIRKMADEFTKFYYSSLNEKSYNKILQHIKSYSIYNSQNIIYKGECIVNYFKNLSDMNTVFSNIDFSCLHSGARRINILVTGVINYNSNNENITQKFTEYIHCGNDNYNNFWIQTSIFKLL